MASTMAPWREVSASDFGALDHSFCRFPHGVAWRLDERLVGLEVRGLPGLSAPAFRTLAASALTRLTAPFDLVVDCRELRIAQRVEDLCELHHLVDRALRAVAPQLRRYVMLVPQDWSTPWWHGVHLFAGLTCPWRVATGHLDAFEWLEAPLEATAAVRDLFASAPSRGPFTALVEAAIVDALEADVEVVARRLGMSVRSLQRALGREGQTFRQLRDQSRLTWASHHLKSGDKVESVAREVGFSSTSHFVIWFRQHSGTTPRDFRRKFSAPSLGGSERA